MSSSRSIAALAACLVGLFAASARAQQPSTPAAVDVPPMTCTNPGNPPQDRTSPEVGRFQKRLDDYKNCVNDYTRATGAKANEYAAQQRAYVDASNKAIDEYNAYVNGLNEAAKNSGGGSGSGKAVGR